MSNRNSSQVVKDIPSIAVPDGNSEKEEATEPTEAATSFRCSCTISFSVVALILLLTKEFSINAPLLAIQLLAIQIQFLSVAALVYALKRVSLHWFKGGRPKTSSGDFDKIMEEVASKIQEEDESILPVGSLEKPLLEASNLPPSRSIIYHVQDIQFGITHKKSGDVVFEGQNTQCVMRLNFKPLESSTNAYSISGSRSGDAKFSSYTFAIPRGFLSTKTLKAWWEETCEEGIRRVVLAQFDEAYDSFLGEWLASDGNRGLLSETRRLVSADDVEANPGDHCLQAVSSPRNETAKTAASSAKAPTTVTCSEIV